MKGKNNYFGLGYSMEGKVIDWTTPEQKNWSLWHPKDAKILHIACIEGYFKKRELRVSSLLIFSHAHNFQTLGTWDVCLDSCQ